MALHRETVRFLVRCYAEGAVCVRVVPSNRERARKYRYRAEELRTKIDGWSDPTARNALEYVACQYDTLAATLEQLPIDPLCPETGTHELPFRVLESAVTGAEQPASNNAAGAASSGRLRQ